MIIIHMLKKIFKTREPGSSFHQQILVKLDQRLGELEKNQEELRQILAEKSWTIDKVIIENMHTDKFEFNLDTIDVRELSGMLSIGLNYGGKLVKVSPPANQKNLPGKTSTDPENSSRKSDRNHHPPGPVLEKQEIDWDKPSKPSLKLSYK